MPAKTRAQAARERREKIRTFKAAPANRIDRRRSDNDRHSAASNTSTRRDVRRSTHSAQSTPAPRCSSLPASHVVADYRRLADEDTHQGSSSKQPTTTESQPQPALSSLVGPRPLDKPVTIDHHIAPYDDLDAFQKLGLAVTRTLRANERIEILKYYVGVSAGREELLRLSIKETLRDVGYHDRLRDGVPLERICKTWDPRGVQNRRVIRRWLREKARKERLEKAVKAEQDELQQNVTRLAREAETAMKPQAQQAGFWDFLDQNDRSLLRSPPSEPSLIAALKTEFEPSNSSVQGDQINTVPDPGASPDAPSQATLDETWDDEVENTAEPDDQHSIESESARWARELQENKAQARQGYLEAVRNLELSRNYYDNWLKYYRWQGIEDKTSEEIEKDHLTGLANNAGDLIERELDYEDAAREAQRWQAMNTNSVQSRFPDPHPEEWQRAVDEEAEWSLGRLKPDRIERWRSVVPQTQSETSMSVMSDAELEVREEDVDVPNLRGVEFGESMSTLAYSNWHGRKIVDYYLQAERAWQEMSLPFDEGTDTEMSGSGERDDEKTDDRGETGTETSSESEPYRGLWGVQRCTVG
jgi:hypothetical protein